MYPAILKFTLNFNTPYTEIYASIKFNIFSKKICHLGGSNLRPQVHYPNTLITISQVVLIIHSKELIYKLE